MPAISTFVILPGNQNIYKSDFLFLEYKSYLDRALKEKGFVEAASEKDADAIIFFDYGIGNPLARVYSSNRSIYTNVPVTINKVKEDGTTRTSIEYKSRGWHRLAGVLVYEYEDNPL